MSGSSSNGRGYGGFEVEREQECSEITFTTKVISPTMVYFGKASIGTVLDVEIDEGIIVLLANKNVVGSITHTIISKLLKCMKAGHRYEADIFEINGASITVTIRAK